MTKYYVFKMPDGCVPEYEVDVSVIGPSEKAGGVLAEGPFNNYKDANAAALRMIRINRYHENIEHNTRSN